MKYIAFIFSLILIPALLAGQSVTVNAVSGQESLTNSEYSLSQGSVRVSGNQLMITGQSVNQVKSWSASSGGKKVGVIESGVGIKLHGFDYSGTKLFENKLEFFQQSDETIKVYSYDSGKMILRDNVANFSFLNPKGESLFSVSNSSQSTGGERISMLSSDANGKTVVLYNPVIAYSNGRGSRATLVFNEQDQRVFFSSDNREIRDLKVSQDGSFITLLTSGSGNNHAYLFDRFGNELFSIDLAEGQLGLSVSDGGEFLTNYSSGRVQVHNTISGEGTGSTTSRNPVLYANYIPQDEMIIVLNGRNTNGAISEGMITAIHVTKRQIARSDINFTVSAKDLESLSLERTGTNRFKLTGLNKSLELRTSF